MAKYISRFGKVYNWKPDPLDFHDYKFLPKLAPHNLPELTNNAPNVPYVFDQGSLGSCTGNAAAMCLDYIRAKENLPLLIPSRLFIYYNERVIEDEVFSDSGAQVRDAIKTLAKEGVCHETTWTYDVDKFTQKPSDAAYQEALNFVIKSYERIDNRNLSYLQSALAEGLPFVFGLIVYQSFESHEVESTGIVPMPQRNENRLGGHCVIGIDYNNETKMVKCKNSWGEAWGDKGYFYLPYEFIINDNLCSDFWVIKIV